MWETLEIEPTTDIKAIKRAYAKLLKKYHPEDYPDKVIEIQEAYNAAIRYAKSKNEPSVIIRKEGDEVPIRKEADDTSAQNPVPKEQHRNDFSSKEMEANNNQVKKKEEIPEYIKNIEKEKNHAFHKKRRKSVQQFVDRLRKGITTRNKKKTKAFLEWMNTVSFSQIASDEFILVELKKILEEAKYCNPIVINQLKQYYQNGKNKKRENEILDILSSEKMKEKQNWYKIWFNQILSIKKETVILGLIVLYFVIALGGRVINVKQAIQNNSQSSYRKTPKHTMVKQFQNLLIDEYQFEKDEARSADIFIDSRVKTDSNFVYLSSHFPVNEEDNISYGALYSLSDGKLVDGKCNLNHKLKNYYQDKYLLRYCLSLETISESYVIIEKQWDMEPLQINVSVCIDNIEEFISALREFEKNFFQDPLVKKEGKTYELNLEINISNMMGLPDCFYNPGEVYRCTCQLTAKSHEIPYITIRREANKIKEMKEGKITDDDRWD